MTTDPATPWEITTERLLLRPWRCEDAEAHRSLWTERDPRARRQIDADGRPSVADLRDWIAARASGRSRFWATVRDWNTASFRVLEKLDFTRSTKLTPDPGRGDTVWMTLAL